MRKKILLLKLYLLLLLIFNGCREEIIEPNNPAGNKNFPVREEKENYFNISINADNLTREMFFDTRFSTETNMVNLNVIDRQSGTCTLKIISKDNTILYSSIIEISNINIRHRIAQGLPSKVFLKFDSFTGQIKLILYKVK